MSTFAHDCATDSPPISKSSAESTEQADELPYRKIDDLSDATRIVQNDLSVKTAIPRSYRSRSCPMQLRSQSFFQLFLASFSTSVRRLSPNANTILDFPLKALFMP
jgi:hypothetical protein